VKAADIIIIGMATLSFPVWVYCVRQQWSRKPGSTARMMKSGCLFAAIILTGMFAAYLLGQN
jgi:hypothetical protein